MPVVYTLQWVLLVGHRIDGKKVHSFIHEPAEHLRMLPIPGSIMNTAAMVRGGDVSSSDKDESGDRKQNIDKNLSNDKQVLLTTIDVI
jgi:hypothetical protein